ncbi:putative ER protein Pkr1 [Lyophyllum shimeji]|uniref:ER protein Pkr1 n=1 Tax=Lyophyllum shimeji TaxID=47721 RepID=A0A9P3PCX5_LYOSH|nr:putative ER protein Pkr1 [Lyophyllum shimeji]
MSASSSDGGEALSFFGDILKPGSSLNPTFLAILDAAFVALFLVFVGLAFATSGNFHIFALMAIELALWASVKWFVNELKNTPIPREEQGSGEKLEESKKDS